MSRHRIALTMASGVASALLLAACGASTDNSADTGAAAPAAGTTVPADGGATATAGTSAGSGDMVSTDMLMAKQTSDGMGTIVTDAKGWTLYRYDKDKAAMSMCTGSCAQTWMPVMAQGTPKVMGVQGKLGTITRDDGMKQITLAGWPLYRYMGDTKVGDMNGQGKDGTWYAATPAGKKAVTSSSSGSGSSPSSSMSGMPGM
ncbi:hypothetical protein [Streptomyces sp. WAC00263]|uniref:COG4315 family predicted lipoprotein n=1 Tax=Streptomyces sp. WAC00263 TaxID=1917422 RepID=UPI0015EEE4DC|nr:hypothetical protein [Streptomyces sp. WAC00263]KAF5990675.1 hypothetical protein BOG92_000455 [Streptomyces sp. WAC00263]